MDGGQVVLQEEVPGQEMVDGAGVSHLPPLVLLLVVVAGTGEEAQMPLPWLRADWAVDEAGAEISQGEIGIMIVEWILAGGIERGAWPLRDVIRLRIEAEAAGIGNEVAHGEGGDRRRGPGLRPSGGNDTIEISCLVLRSTKIYRV
jgi:hypothetical protein